MVRCFHEHLASTLAQHVSLTACQTTWTPVSVNIYPSEGCDELNHWNGHLLCHRCGWVRSRTKGFEVEHQSEGTDGSLISKLEPKMINALEQLHPTRAPQNKLSSIYMDVYERVWRGCVLCESLLSMCISLYADDVCLFLFCPLHICCVQPSRQHEWQTELQVECQQQTH